MIKTLIQYIKYIQFILALRLELVIAYHTSGD